MRSPQAFLRFFVKAALNALGGRVAGDLVVEVLPDVARDLWDWWGKGQAESALRGEIQGVAQLSPVEAQQQAVQLVAEEAAGKPEGVRRQVADLVAQVPQAVRASQRRGADPSGRSVSPALRVRGPEDLLPLLPVRPPRFQAGQRPLPGGDWELVELLGVGGFGEVWRAHNPHLGEEAALKFCLDAKAAQTLRNEAALLRQVREHGTHPGIVRLRATYLSADPPCLEYEYVPGGDLAGLIREWGGRAGAEWSSQVVLGLAQIIAFAHAKGIVHRDLKPANVLVAACGLVVRGTNTCRVRAIPY